MVFCFWDEWPYLLVYRASFWIDVKLCSMLGCFLSYLDKLCSDIVRNSFMYCYLGQFHIFLFRSLTNMGLCMLSFCKGQTWTSSMSGINMRYMKLNIATNVEQLWFAQLNTATDEEHVICIEQHTHQLEHLWFTVT